MNSEWKKKSRKIKFSVLSENDWHFPSIQILKNCRKMWTNLKCKVKYKTSIQKIKKLAYEVKYKTSIQKT